MALSPGNDDFRELLAAMQQLHEDMMAMIKAINKGKKDK
jgi:hypothetical protein